MKLWKQGVLKSLQSIDTPKLIATADIRYAKNNAVKYGPKMLRGPSGGRTDVGGFITGVMLGPIIAA